MISRNFPCKTGSNRAKPKGQSRPDKTPVQNEDRMTPIKSLTTALLLGLSSLVALPAQAELNITIDSPVIEPMPFAVPDFIDEGGAGDYASNIARVVAADLAGTGLFIETPQDACTRASIQDAFAASGGDIKKLMVALTQTDAFLYGPTAVGQN